MGCESIPARSFAIGKGNGDLEGTFMQQLLLLFCVVFLSFGMIVAQQGGVFRKHEPKGCEYNNISLEQANRDANSDTVILIIGRLGNKDRKKDITERRLYSASAYLTQYLSYSRSTESVVAAEGKNIGNEFGVLEIYVNGKLYDTLLSNPDFDIGLGSCDSLESDDASSRAKRSILYPWKFYKPKK